MHIALAISDLMNMTREKKHKHIRIKQKLKETKTNGIVA